MEAPKCEVAKSVSICLHLIFNFCVFEIAYLKEKFFLGKFSDITCRNDLSKSLL